MRISRNTVSKYLKRLEEFKTGSNPKIIYKKSTNYRKISPDTVKRIHELLNENRSKPVKLRYTAKKIWYKVVSEGHNLSYTSVKRIVKDYREKHTLIHDVYIEQVPKIGKRAEFDWGYIPLIINGVKKMYPMAFMVLNKSLYRYAYIFYYTYISLKMKRILRLSNHIWISLMK